MEQRSLAVHQGDDAVDGASLLSTPVVPVEYFLAAQRQVQEFVSKVLEKGVDYGVIPGTNGKNTMLKPGAEKLCNLFGLTPEYEWGRYDVQLDPAKGPPSVFCQALCSLRSRKTGDLVVVRASGSCNNQENKYRTMPAANIVNTIEKMAQKRAMVAAVLVATRLSHKFTQDMDDDIEDAQWSEEKRSGSGPAAKAKSRSGLSAPGQASPKPTEPRPVVETVAKSDEALKAARNAAFKHIKRTGKGEGTRVALTEPVAVGEGEFLGFGEYELGALKYEECTAVLEWLTKQPDALPI